MNPLLSFFHRSKDDNNNEPAAKKHKTGSLDDVNAIIEKKIASQNKELHHWKNTLKNLKQQVLIEILETNNQFVPKENDDVGFPFFLQNKLSAVKHMLT